MFAQKRSTRGGRAPRPEFKFNTAGVMSLHFRQPRQILRHFQLLQSFMPFQTTPVIPSKSTQNGVAKSQLRFGQVPSDKISIPWRKFRALQSFPRQQQTGATVHHQSGGFCERNTFSVAMMLATRQQTLFTPQPAMSHD